MNAPARQDITGLVLAGGRGSRMGGVDKGLQTLASQPLVRHALDRLAPQVATVVISANRHLERYAALGHAVVPDTQGGYPGPLAGLIAGWSACTTPWLVSVPCDAPAFPTDLVARLASALAASPSMLAMPVTRHPDGTPQVQPVFCLMHQSLRASLADFVRGGGRGVERWAMQQECLQVPFDDAAAFFNANTLNDLESLHR